MEALTHSSHQLSISGLAVLDVRDVPVEHERWLEACTQKYAPQTVLWISNDQRSSGCKLIRRNDHPQVDFNRIRQLPGVGFVHTNGFLAVLQPQADPIAFIPLAIVTP